MDRKTASGFRHARLVLKFGICFAVFYAPLSLADSFNYSADLYGAVTYTNNVSLSPEGGEENESILEISPTLFANRDGKRLDVDFVYRFQGLLYAREDSRNEVYNYLEANVESILVPDLIFLDATASISQTVVDPSISSGYSSISVSGNSAEVATYTVSPYLQRKLAPFTSVRAGFRGGLVEYDEARLLDSQEGEIFASLINEGGDTPFNWRADYQIKSVEYDIGQEIELSRISGEVGFRISPRTEIVVSGGEDDNEFGSLPGTTAADGSFWDAGLRGGIGNNIEYDFRVGEQFFGDSYSATFRRTAPRLTTELSYNERATTVGAQQLDYTNALSFLSGLGNVQDLSNINGFDLPVSDPELYIRRRFNLANTLTRGKSTFRNRIYYEDRTFIRTTLAGAKENVLGVRFEWAWDFDDVTTLNSTINYQRLDSRDGFSQPEDLRLTVTARRTIYNASYVLARAWINRRSALSDGFNYDEFALTIGFGRQF